MPRSAVLQLGEVTMLRDVVFLLFVVGALVPGTSGRATWKPCGSPELFFTWDNMQMQPDPAILGEHLTVHILGRALGDYAWYQPLAVRGSEMGPRDLP